MTGADWLAFVPILFLTSVLPLSLGIWALIDSSRRPDAAWTLARQPKQLWLILNIVGMLFCFLVPLAYLVVARPKLRRAAGGA